MITFPGVDGREWSLMHSGAFTVSVVRVETEGLLTCSRKIATPLASSTDTISSTLRLAYGLDGSSQTIFMARGSKQHPRGPMSRTIISARDSGDRATGSERTLGDPRAGFWLTVAGEHVPCDLIGGRPSLYETVRLHTPDPPRG
jgi:hypothetical protein